MRKLLLSLALVPSLWAASNICGNLAFNPITQQLDCIGVSGGAGGGSTISIGPFASLPVTVPAAGNTYETTDAFYRFVSDGSVWQPFLNNWDVQQPLAATFSAAGSGGGTPTVDTTHGGIIFAMASTGGDSINWRVKNLANAAPYTILGAFYTPNLASVNNFIILGLRESATGKGVGLGFRGNASALFVPSIASDTSWSGLCAATISSIPGNGIWFSKTTVDGSGNIKFYIASDPWNYTHVAACDTTVALRFTTAPDQWGVAIESEDTNVDTKLSWVHYQELAGLH